MNDKLTFGADKAKGSCQCCGKEIDILDWEAGQVHYSQLRKQ